MDISVKYAASLEEAGGAAGGAPVNPTLTHTSLTHTHFTHFHYITQSLTSEPVEIRLITCQDDHSVGHVTAE